MILKFIAIYYFLVGEFSSRATLIIIFIIMYHYHMCNDIPFWLQEMVYLHSVIYEDRLESIIWRWNNSCYEVVVGLNKNVGMGLNKNVSKEEKWKIIISTKCNNYGVKYEF